MAKHQSTYPYDVVAEKALFLASKVVTKDAGFDDLSHNSSLIRELEIDTGAKIGSGLTSKYLKDFTPEQPLGPMAIVTNDHLSLHHSGLDSTGGWKEHYIHYGTKTKFGHVILAGTLEHFRKWANSKACTDECAKVKNGRLFAYVQGYLVHVDAENNHASANIENGEGFIVWAGGHYYTGDIHKGEPHGNGTLTLPSGSYYAGQFVNGSSDGRCVMEYDGGNRYEGEFHNSQKHGEGVFWFTKSGNRYEGQWSEDKKTGHGTLIFAGGNRYEGQWSEDIYTGHGTFIWADGTRYVGEWVDGDMHGRGKKTRPNGTVIHDGMWNHDEPVS